MIWTRQYYELDLSAWLEERGAGPFVAQAAPTRNRDWFHMLSRDVISMPDKWEYPWFAAWDLAFHTGALALTDIDFAKYQVELCLSNPYLHPNGQLPAHEWNFSDVNPPVHAWATLFVFQYERQVRGAGDLEFLSRCFRRLQLNFTWWVNRKDPTGRNVFQGGFLGLDNIGVFDRSAPSVRSRPRTGMSRFPSGCMGRSIASHIRRPSLIAACSAAIPTGAARCGCRFRPSGAVTAASVSLLRR